MYNNAIFSLNIFILVNMDVLIYVFFMLTSNEFIIAIS